MARHERKIDLNKLIKGLKNKSVEMGFFETARYTDGTPVASVAVVHELGSVKKGIPPRSFLNPALEGNRKKYASVIAQGVKSAIAGKISVIQLLGQVGEFAVGDIKKEISEIENPKLQESTLRARDRRHYSGVGSSKPLVDTGVLIESVSYRVSEKDAE